MNIWLLTEDSSKHAEEVLEQIVRKAIFLVEPDVVPTALFFPPLQASDKGVTKASYWRSSDVRHEDARRRLTLFVATSLIRGDFVVFHADGDKKWSERETSSGLTAFWVWRANIGRVVASRRGAESARIMQRLALAMPFWEIEAWLYQNLPRAANECKLSCGRHLSLIAEWRDNPALLDEQENPKDLLCFGSNINSDLAHTFPARRVDALDRSFHAFVEEIRRPEWKESLVARRRRATPS